MIPSLRSRCARKGSEKSTSFQALFRALVLSRLADLGGGTLRQIDLARSMRWDKARLSHHLTRMQDRGLIEREHVSGKEVFVKITKQGQSVLSDARPAHASSVRRHLLDRLSHEETKALLKILTRLSAQSPPAD